MPRLDDAQLFPTVLAAIRAEVATEVNSQVKAEHASLLAEVESLKDRVSQLEAAVSSTNGHTTSGRQSIRQSGYRAVPSDMPASPESDTRSLQLMSQEETSLGAEVDATITDMPASFVAYCFAKLTVSQSPCMEPALYMLLLFVMLQQLTTVAFVEGNNMAYFQQEKQWGIEDRAGAETPFAECMMESRMIRGEPLLIFVIGFSAFVMISLSIKKCAEQYLSALYPRRQERFVLWCLTSAIWIVQNIFIPGIFAAEASMLLARSVDLLEIILNTLALTFLLEMDRMVYNSLLTERERDEYQDMAGDFEPLQVSNYKIEKFTFKRGESETGQRLATRSVSRSASRTFLVCVVFMMVLFIVLRQRQEDGFLGYLQVEYSFVGRGLLIIMFLITFIQLWQWSGCERKCSCLRQALCGVLLPSLVMPFAFLLGWQTAMSLLVTGNVPLHPDYAALLTRCLDLPASNQTGIVQVMAGGVGWTPPVPQVPVPHINFSLPTIHIRSPFEVA